MLQLKDVPNFVGCHQVLRVLRHDTDVVADRLVMLGVAATVKLLPLLATPDTVTTTFPVVAPVGTIATMLLALQLVTVAVLPLNLTVLLPCVEPKPEPLIVTDAPTAPEVGDKLEIVGAAIRTGAKSNSRMERVKKTKNCRMLGIMDAPPEPLRQ